MNRGTGEVKPPQPPTPSIRTLRSVLAPILFGIGVDLDHLYRSYLTTHLAKFGFSISSDEVVRSKQSVMQSDDCNPNLQPFPACFTQWVADNVDQNVVTMDGLDTFHEMGLDTFHGMGHLKLNYRGKKTLMFSPCPSVSESIFS